MILEIWSATDRISAHFGPNNPENQNFEKMKKKSGAIIVSHKLTINDNHMIYGS